MGHCSGNSGNPREVEIEMSTYTSNEQPTPPVKSSRSGVGRGKGLFNFMLIMLPLTLFWNFGKFQARVTKMYFEPFDFCGKSVNWEHETISVHNAERSKVLPKRMIFSLPPDEIS